MYKEINLTTNDGGEKAFKFLATGTTAYRYRQIFNQDLMVQLNKMKTFQDGGASDETADSMIFEKLAFIMNAQAEGKNMNTLNFDSFLEWADQFSGMELITHALEIIELYLGSKITRSIPKKD